MACESLRQEQVSRRPVDVRDGGVPQGVEPVDAVKPSLPLPRRPSELDPALRDPAAGLVGEQRGGRGRLPRPAAASSSRTAAAWRRADPVRTRRQLDRPWRSPTRCAPAPAACRLLRTHRRRPGVGALLERTLRTFALGNLRRHVWLQPGVGGRDAAGLTLLKTQPRQL